MKLCIHTLLSFPTVLIPWLLAYDCRYIFFMGSRWVKNNNKTKHRIRNKYANKFFVFMLFEKHLWDILQTMQVTKR